MEPLIEISKGCNILIYTESNIPYWSPHTRLYRRFPGKDTKVAVPKLRHYWAQFIGHDLKLCYLKHSSKLQDVNSCVWVDLGAMVSNCRGCKTDFPWQLENGDVVSMRESSIPFWVLIGHLRPVFLCKTQIIYRSLDPTTAIDPFWYINVIFKPFL